MFAATRSQSPALAPHIPTVGATLVALLLAVTAAILGSLAACRVAEVLFVPGHARLSFAKAPSGGQVG
jgi:hypothetical protein